MGERSFLPFIVAALLMLPAAAAEAQPSEISTLVILVLDDAERPLPAVHVLLHQQEGVSLERTSDDAGRVIFAGIPGGRYTATVQQGDRPEESFGIGVPPGEGVQAVLRLATSLDAVAVEADRLDEYLERRGFYLRQRVSDADFYDRAAIAASGARRLSAFFQRVPRVRVDAQRSGAVLINQGFRACPFDVFVDGQPVFGPDLAFSDMFDLDALQTEQVAGVEIYRRQRDAPAEYRGRGCGSVLLWTANGAE